MTEQYLTDEWFGAVAVAAGGLLAMPGFDTVIDIEVAGTPDGKVRYHEVWANGRLASVASGKADSGEVKFVLKYPDAVNLVSGAITDDVAFMQGRFKIDGSYEKWLFGFRPVVSTDEYRAFRGAVAGLTTFA